MPKAALDNCNNADFKEMVRVSRYRQFDFDPDEGYLRRQQRMMERESIASQLM